MPSIQIHYEFKDWEKAFSDYYRNLEKYKESELRLVINTNPYTEGYWVETTGYSLVDGDKRYTTKKQVDALKKRVEKAVEQSEKSGLAPGLIL